MAEQWQIRRGTTQENDDFVGAEGELTMDTEKKQLRIHDGSTQGGAGMIDPVVAFQNPNANNNYTGYRKYASGYVEIWGTRTGMNQREYTGSITLPITMADTRYACFVYAWSNRGTDTDWNFTGGCTPKTTTKFSFSLYGLGTSDLVTGMSWSVKGMAA